jgi:hypothetical protein
MNITVKVDSTPKELRRFMAYQDWLQRIMFGSLTTDDVLESIKNSAK